MKRNEFISEQGQLGSEILLNIAETLALRLPEGSEKAIAAKWVKKFLACDPKDYKHYLSLFICSLTKQVLVDPFDVPPEEPRNQWQGFENEYTMEDIRFGARLKIFAGDFTPEYRIDISQDLKEYVAFQEIPFFGSHFYYAFSPNDTINHWSKFNKLNVPRKHVVALEKAGELEKELEESMIKGRFGGKPRGRAKRRDTIKMAAEMKKKSIPKPNWEGGIEEEPEEVPESPKKNMMTIPTGVPAKAIPPALQRRMLEAEQKRQERLSAKAEERDKHLSQAQTPLTRKTLTRKSGQIPRKSAPPTSSSPSTSSSATPAVRKNSLRKTILQNKASSRGESLLEEFSKAEENVAYGPLNKTEFYRDYIERKKREMGSVVPPEIPDQLLRASTVLENEIERAKRDRTPNSRVVDAIQDQEIEIGQKLLKALEAEERVESVIEGAVEMENEFKDLWKNLTLLNQTAARPVVAPATVRKFQELKERASMLPREIAEISSDSDENSNIFDESIISALTKRGLMPEGGLPVIAAENIMEVMNHTAQVAKDAIENLSNLQPTNAEEEKVILDLISNNCKLITDVASRVPEIIEAVENNAPDLIEFTKIIAAELSKSINVSTEADKEIALNAKPTEIALQAADIEDERNEGLQKVLTQVEEDFAGEYVPKDARVRKHFGHDGEKELIDLDKVDVEFEGGFMDATEFFETSRAQRDEKALREQKRFSAIHESAARDALIEDIEEEFIHLVDESLEVIDEAVEDMKEAQTKAKTPQEKNEIEVMKQRALEYKKTLLEKEARTKNQTRVGGLVDGWEKTLRG